VFSRDANEEINMQSSHDDSENEHELERHAELLAAAHALLEAREDQMVTADEWNRLQQAVNAAKRKG